MAVSVILLHQHDSNLGGIFNTQNADSSSSRINLLVVLTSGALNLTPIYRIETPILMLTNILIILLIGKLFSDLFCKPQNVRRV